MKMDPKLEGGNWGKHLDLVSLKPVSALCAENRIDKTILKVLFIHRYIPMRYFSFIGIYL